MKRTWLEISRTMGSFFSLNLALLVSNRVLPDHQQDAPIVAVYPLRLTESAKVRVCVDFIQRKRQ